MFPSVKAYDDILKADYVEAMRLLTTSGAHLFDMPTPYLGQGRIALEQSSPSRFDRLNQIFGEAVADSGVNATRIDYPAWLGPVGEPKEERLRRDGVHLSDIGIEEFTDYVLTKHVLVGD